MTKSNGSRHSEKSAPPKDAMPIAGPKTRAVGQAKLVPLRKRLFRLRKEESKRRRQLERVQAKASRTSSEMSELLEAMSVWLKSPDVVAASQESNGSNEKVAPKS